MNDHPITPPPEMVQQWLKKADQYVDQDNDETYFDYVATQAAQWGADQELEACCEWMRSQNLVSFNDRIASLRAARRLKPLSLKEQALALIDECTDPAGDYLDDNALTTIRRALEALPE